MRLSLAGDRSTDSLFRALIHRMVLHTRTCCQGILPTFVDERRRHEFRLLRQRRRLLRRRLLLGMHMPRRVAPPSRAPLEVAIPRGTATSRSHVEADVQDVAVLDDVRLPLDALVALARGFGVRA